MSLIENIQSANQAHILQNGIWRTYHCIGNYSVEGVLENTYLFPSDVQEKDSWKELSNVITPIQLIHHIWDIENNINDIEELYGQQFSSNYELLENDIHDLMKFIEDKSTGDINYRNLMQVELKKHINGFDGFHWSEEGEWAKSDNQLVLFESIPDGYSSFINSEVLDKLLELLTQIWNQLIK